MRILHVTIGMNFEEGGTQTVVRGLTKALAKKGVDISIFTTTNPEANTGNICTPEGTKVKIFKRDFFSRFWNSHSFDFSRAINEEIKSFDLVNIHGIWNYPSFSTYWAAKKFNKPYIVMLHGALEPKSLSFKPLRKIAYFSIIQKKILREAAALWAANQEEADNLKKILKTGRIIIIPNGLDLDEFKGVPERRILDQYYPELKNKTVITFLGRIHPIKGIDILIKAFSQAAKVDDNLRLAIVGPDNDGYKNELEKIAKTEKISEKIIFTGIAIGEKKLAIVGNSDILVLPSRSEVKGLVLAEAMACGVPVVATRQCHFPEIGEVKAGIITDADSDQIAKAILELAKNPALRKQMGENGKNFVFQNLSWEKISVTALNLYKSVLNEQISKREI